MNLLERLLPDPENKPINQALIVPDTELEPDEIVPDEGDSKEVGNGEASA
jgi:hypothetical protein